MFTFVQTIFLVYLIFLVYSLIQDPLDILSRSEKRFESEVIVDIACSKKFEHIAHRPSLSFKNENTSYGRDWFFFCGEYYSSTIDPRLFDSPNYGCSKEHFQKDRKKMQIKCRISNNESKLILPVLDKL